MADKTGNETLGKETLDDIKEILATDDPVTLFGANGKRARIRYRRLVRSVHPDANHDDPRAREATQRLNALWEAYGRATGTDGTMRKPKSGGDGTHDVHEVARTDAFVLLAERDGWLVVDRQAGRMAPEAPEAERVSDLGHILAGSPVHVLTATSTKAIRQADGEHEAVRTSVPAFYKDADHVLGLRDLPAHLPSGKLEPRDAAWMAKRALFLVAALAKAHLSLDPSLDMADCVAWDTDAHVLMLLTPHRMRDKPRIVFTDYGEVRLTPSGYDEGTMSDVTDQRRQTKPMLDAIRAMLDEGDPTARRLIAFFRGMDVDQVTETADLFAEYDGMLLELFGRPTFHEMRVV